MRTLGAMIAGYQDARGSRGSDFLEPGDRDSGRDDYDATAAEAALLHELEEADDEDGENTDHSRDLDRSADRSVDRSADRSGDRVEQDDYDDDPDEAELLAGLEEEGKQRRSPERKNVCRRGNVVDLDGVKGSGRLRGRHPCARDVR